MAESKDTMVGVGAPSGRVQRAEKAGSPRFCLYDPLFEATVECFIDPDHVEQARSLEGKRAAVVGRITRSPVTGRLLSVRDILSVDVVDASERVSYQQARGAISWPAGDLLPEEAIRRGRGLTDDS